MKIAIASGKGGTGKTMIATNLAYIASLSYPVQLYDLDVEEPNDHLFFNTPLGNENDVEMMIPVVDEEKCTHCGICTKVCEYHSIITLPDRVMVFPELCHSCYGCLEMCPEGAISEGFKSIGTISSLHQENINLVTGRLKISESATAALISKTKDHGEEDNKLIFYDSPPGSSCPVIEAVKDCDYVILASEPSPFGLHDMDLVARTLIDLKVPFGVIVNKDVKNNTLIDNYCSENKIEIIGRIPLSMEIAQAYASGGIVSKAVDDMDVLFKQILETIILRAEGQQK